VQVTDFSGFEMCLGCTMGLMKKHLRRWRTPRLNCPCSASRVRQKPVQLDLFGSGDFYYHEGRLYVVSSQEDEPKGES